MIPTVCSWRRFEPPLNFLKVQFLEFYLKMPLSILKDCALIYVLDKILERRSSSSTVSDGVVELRTALANYLHIHFLLEALLNKTGTSQVGAISKAQKAQNFFWKKIEIFEKIFLSENVA